MTDLARPRAARMADAFDRLSPAYDHAYHDAIAGTLVDWVRPGPSDRVADAACGAGAVALAVARVQTGGVRVLAVDLSEQMVAIGRRRADLAGLPAQIDWRIGEAAPLPVPDGSLDLVLCASSLHFLGVSALVDWRRALRPGGRLGFTLPVAGDFRAGGEFAALLAADIVLPRSAGEACELPRRAGFAGAYARVAPVGGRHVVVMGARA